MYAFPQVEIKSGGVNTFSSIEKGEYNRLFDYVNQKKLRIKNRGKMVSSPARPPEEAAALPGWLVSCSLLSMVVCLSHLLTSWPVWLLFYQFDVLCIATIPVPVVKCFVLSCASTGIHGLVNYQTHFGGVRLLYIPQHSSAFKHHKDLQV